tara:strand:+ start:3037 stop:4029 length:993 start_codon:yes stop_codon:yes gene_type:complete
MDNENNKPKDDADDASRRDFIKKAGLVTASGVALASLPGVVRAAEGSEGDTTDKPLKGRTALITGAARGIGLAMAMKLAQQGANIALLDIASPNALQGIISYPLSSRQDLEQATALVKKQGVGAIPLIADVRNRAQMLESINNAVQTFGGLDIVIANAGISNGAGFENENETIFKEIMNVNVAGVANTVHPAIAHLKKSKYGGRVIAISSVAGRRGVAELASYSASKWAVIGLMKSLSLDLGRYKITANAIAPTAVKTVMWQGEDTDNPIKNISNTAMDLLVKSYHSLPTGSIHPEEIANAAAFLASDNAHYISGITLDVNAGWSGQMTG